MLPSPMISALSVTLPPSAPPVTKGDPAASKATAAYERAPPIAGDSVHASPHASYVQHAALDSVVGGVVLPMPCLPWGYCAEEDN